MKIVAQQENWKKTATPEELEPLEIQLEAMRETRESWLKVDRIIEERYE